MVRASEPAAENLERVGELEARPEAIEIVGCVVEGVDPRLSMDFAAAAP
jgi:hypothetical protein